MNGGAIPSSPKKKLIREREEQREAMRLKFIGLLEKNPGSSSRDIGKMFTPRMDDCTVTSYLVNLVRKGRIIEKRVENGMKFCYKYYPLPKIEARV